VCARILSEASIRERVRLRLLHFKTRGGFVCVKTMRV
jgi:hypothetical protein